MFNKRKNRAFSIAEILISILIITIALLLAVPVITKKNVPSEQKFRGGAAVFFFNNQKNTASANYPCFTTRAAGSGNNIIIEETKGNCQSYEFIVPQNVHKVNLTLVAGGGGGGGAAGGTLYSENFYSSDSASKTVALDILKGVKINLMTGAGQSGTAATAASYKGGTGGKSAHGIYNYTMLKDFLLKRIGYTISTFENGSAALSYLSGFTSTGASGSPASINGTGLSFKVGNNSYNLFAEDYNGTGGVACFVQKGTNFSENKTNATGCSISGHSYIAPKLGQQGDAISSSTQIDNFIAYTVSGGIGGSITGEETIKGAGGKGGGIVYTCKDAANKCAISNTNSQLINAEIIEKAFNKKNRYGETAIVVKHPGGVGAGGAGGTAVKINGLAVKPGAKYTIVVGAGGAGGAKGMQGSIVNGAKSEATKGGNGISGSASALYDENGRLMILVAGGIGGYGGKINNTTGGISSISKPEFPDAARYVPVVIYDDSLVDAENLLDKDVVSNFTTPNAFNYYVELPDEIDNSMSVKYVNYKYVDKKITPFYELNSNLTAILGGGSVNLTTTTPAYDNLSGGFSNFNNWATSASGAAATTNVNYNGVSNKTVYNGFYYRNAFGDDLGYAGGLGGFSGLGTKAGCGGLFAGNARGLLSDGTENAILKNTFATSSTSGGGKIFAVNDYYSNCSASTPDGQTAEFIAPTQAVGSGLHLGQAGSGGGGGGWSSVHGSGNGGKGQNGYVFIQWQTK